MCNAPPGLENEIKAKVGAGEKTTTTKAPRIIKTTTRRPQPRTTKARDLTHHCQRKCSSYRGYYEGYHKGCKCPGRHRG